MASSHPARSHDVHVASRRDTGTMALRMRDAADDYYKLLAVILEFKIDYGVTMPADAEQAKDVIRKRMSEIESQYDKQEFMDKRSKLLADNLRKERKHQQECKLLFESTLDEVSKLNTFMTCQLHLYCGDFIDMIKKRLETLDEGRVRIFIAGEICAGKSSVLNMLMGGEYMPMEHGPCTRIPCEVINSVEKKAHLHYEDNRLHAASFALDDNPNHSSWQRVRSCVESAIDDDMEDIRNKRLEKVVVHWPLPLFTKSRHAATTKIADLSLDEESADVVMNGVTFIDAPGIFDTENSFKSLYPYIQSADAFLVVINNSDNCGVARDRILRLLSDIRDISEKKHGMFYPKCSLFLCNKWDRVMKERQESLKAEIFDKLSENWTRLSEKQLVPFVASTEAIQAVQQGCITEEYERFYFSMCTFVETAVRIQTEAHSWWLKSFLEKTFAIMRNTEELVHYAKSRRKDVLKHLQEYKIKVLQFGKRRKEIEATINKETGDTITEIKEQTRQSLSTKKLQLATWDSCEIPIRNDGESWKHLNEKLHKAVIDRLEHKLDTSKQIKALEEKFFEKVKGQLSELVNLYQDLERQMPLIAHVSGKKTLTVADLGSLTTSYSTWPFIVAGLALILPLAPIILILWHMYDEIHLPQHLDDENLFLNDAKEYMKRQTLVYIENILKNRLPIVAEACMQNFPQNAKYMLTFFHSCVERYLNSINELSATISLSKAHTEENDDCLTKIAKVSKSTEEFLIGKMLKYEIDGEQLRVDVADTTKHIGKGNCTVVCEGILHGNIKDIAVAVKAIKLPKGDGNFPDGTFIFREYFTMRMLSQKPQKDRENFVEFLGALTEVNINEFVLLLVMERCHYNLNDLIKKDKLTLPSGDELPFPGNDSAKGDGWGYALNIALQAAKGLEFVHDNNIVHRDVKPQNFLIKFIADNNIVVKIADVGLSREINLIKTAYIGTPLYNAPEVLLDSRTHSFESDIYSFGLVVWEIWYGKTVFDKLATEQLRTAKRKQPEMTRVTPPDSLKTKLILSWNTERKKRPNITTMVDCLSELTQEFRWPK